MHAFANLVDMILLRLKGAPRKIAPVKMSPEHVSDKVCGQGAMGDERGMDLLRALDTRCGICNSVHEHGVHISLDFSGMN